MINANELRPGNWVNVIGEIPDERTDREVFSVECDYKKRRIGTYWLQECSHAYWNEDLVNPIELTEEWFVKFGFVDNWERDWKTARFEIRGFEFYINKETFQPEQGGYTFLPYELKYVHQLQNLCFFLTGEELTYKR